MTSWEDKWPTWDDQRLTYFNELSSDNQNVLMFFWENYSELAVNSGAFLVYLMDEGLSKGELSMWIRKIDMILNTIRNINEMRAEKERKRKGKG